MNPADGRANPPLLRVSLLVASLVVASALSFLLTGDVIPPSPRDALIYQNALLLLVLGSSLIEHKFTRPVDSLVNSLMGLVTLMPVYRLAPRFYWWVMMGYTLVVLVASATCVAVSDSPGLVGWKAKTAETTYRIGTTFGAARLYFSLLLVFGAFSFYGMEDYRLAVLLLFWGGYLALLNAGVPLLSTLFSGGRSRIAQGDVVKTDWPNIVRVSLGRGVTWRPDSPKMCALGDGEKGVIVPLYSETQATRTIGTGLFLRSDSLDSQDIVAGAVYGAPKDLDLTDIARQAAGDVTAEMIGFVVEDSDIATLRFETWDRELCAEGRLVWVPTQRGHVYYQVLNGQTREESSEANRRGYQVGIATQLGLVDPERGFVKYPWLPWMNTPVYAVPADFGDELLPRKEGDFELGTIPGSKIPVRLVTKDAFAHHLAILGVTGSGKTELTFDIVRHAVGLGIKVVCVDLTARYAGRLADLTPKSLSIEENLATELSEKLFAVETGQFKASEEKKALEAFSKDLKKSIAVRIKEFLETSDDANRVGIVTLPEISNTKATLHITELYLTLLLRYAKNKGEQSPPILIVLEEAHTVIPEASTMGLGDVESKGLVGKIAQIALQGRKYRVGLLVVAQRTATVSKTVLTQCNTIISFACIDDTSLGFLANVYGSSFARQLPNLPFLHAVAFGKSIRSEHPVVVKIPHVSAKVDAH